MIVFEILRLEFKKFLLESCENSEMGSENLEDLYFTYRAWEFLVMVNLVILSMIILYVTVVLINVWLIGLACVGLALAYYFLVVFPWGLEDWVNSARSAKIKFEQTH